MQTPIKYYIREVYGNRRMYFQNETVADTLRSDAIQKLTGSMTIRPQDMENLTVLGFKFQQVLSS